MSIWQVDVARARWRADLLESKAVALRSVNLITDAEAAEAKAARGRAFADLVETFETARVGMDHTSPEYIVLRDRFANARRAARVAAGRGGGNPELMDINTVNNFAEPSDDELLEAMS